MRRFSQQNNLVTLSDINVTPLLDLAFVLLIIFMITTPLLDQGIQLNLPKGGEADGEVNSENVRIVDFDPAGVYYLDKQAMELDALIAELVKQHRDNPELIIYTRGDMVSQWGTGMAVVNRLTKAGVTSFSFRFENE